jgi:hypothetical protein
VPTTSSDADGRQAAAPLARIALALLVLATCGALLIAQQLKHDQPLVSANAIWHPSQGPFDPRTTPASFSFVSAYRDDVSVAIVSSNGKLVATLARNYPVVPHRSSRIFEWRGPTSSGALAPAGSYRVQIHFDRLDRTTLVPQVAFDVSYGAR